MRKWMLRLGPLDEMFYILIGALALFLGVGAVYLNWQKAQQADLLARQNRRAVSLIRQFELSLAEAQSGHRGFLLTGEAEFLQPFSRAMESLDGQLILLREMGAARGPIGARLPQIEQLARQKMEELSVSAQAAWLGEREFAAGLVMQGRQMSTTEKLRDAMAELELSTLNEGERLNQTTLSSMKMAALLAVICCLGLFILFAVETQRTAARRRAAEHASAVKSAFLASMSHELRTPLNAVIGYSQMLQEEAETDNRTSDYQDLQKIESAGKHLLELINSILEMSKIEAGKVEVHASPFQVPDLVSEVVELVRPMAAKNGNTLDIVIGPGVTRMYSDVVKIRQCLLNLLSNASKFTQKGKVTLRVERVIEGQRTFLRFDVMDSGPGIPAEEQELLFEPFHQLESTPVRGKGQGTGLGLAITRRLTRMLGGDTYVQSEMGLGSTFTLSLPEELTLGALHAAPPLGPSDKPTVLVIDDDTAIHGLVRRLFEKHPVEVAVARNGEEGIRMARLLNPRVITLDVVMEGADGWEILRRLKGDPQLARIPVILLSILDTHGDPRGFLADEVFTKPVDVDRLSSAILRHAASGRAHSALIVDDSPDARVMLKRQLQNLGWTLYEAADGAEALEKCEEVQPGVVVLDLMMPNVDGFEFLTRLRSTDRGRETPVLVVTAMDLDPVQRQRLSQQAAAVVHKGALRGNDLIAQVLATLE
ncbi:MAG TPA: response regulator [Bryobacteraceae bacterium]|nr:response regulator [Bryobacteraceae bacterium]